MGKFKGWPIVSDYPDRKSHESNPPVQPMVVQTALLSACVNRNLSCPLLVNVLFPPQHSLSAISSAQSPTGGRCSRLQPLWLPTWLWISHKESQEEEPSWTRTPQHTVLFQPLFNHYCCRTVCLHACNTTQPKSPSWYFHWSAVLNFHQLRCGRIFNRFWVWGDQLPSYCLLECRWMNAQDGRATKIQFWHFIAVNKGNKHSPRVAKGPRKVLN